MVNVDLKRLPHSEGLPLPKYQTAGSAAVDLHAALFDPLVIGPGERQLIATGLALAIPQGYEGQVRSRSGLALKQGVIVLNAPGTIDSDYRGEVGVILANLGEESVEIKRGDRIAQLAICAVARATFVEVSTIEDTERGSGGFGSTGGTG